MAPGGYSFHTLFKNYYKAQNPHLITLKFCTAKQHIKANSQTKFCMILINFQDIINSYLREKLKVLSRLEGKLFTKMV